jgi:hypothetical protein
LTKRFLLSLCAAAFCAAGLHATPVQVDFVRAELPPNSTTTPLPFFMAGGASDTLFFKFKVPGIAQIAHIDSFTIDLTVFDDDDGGGETFEGQFALPSSNIPLFFFFGNLNHLTAASPLAVQLPVDPANFDPILQSMQDGNFRIKLLRDSGDFFVSSLTVSIDATLIPEPGTIGLVAGGLVLAGLVRRRKVS